MTRAKPTRRPPERKCRRCRKVGPDVLPWAGSGDREKVWLCEQHRDEAALLAKVCRAVYGAAGGPTKALSPVEARGVAMGGWR